MSMISGVTVSMHKNSCCKVASSEARFAGQLCNVVSFNTRSQKWKVQLDSGQRTEISEPDLQLVFSLLPSSCGRLGFYHELGFEDTQGSCGRGLVAKQDVKAGMPIFQEPPLLVVREDLDQPGGKFTVEHHRVRWQPTFFLSPPEPLVVVSQVELER